MSNLKLADNDLAVAQDLFETESMLRDTLPLAIEIISTISSVPVEQLSYALMTTLTAPGPGLSDFVEYVIPKITEPQLKKNLEKRERINNSEYKYLINSPKHREVFISRLNEELDKIRNTSSFGYHTQDENERFKQCLIDNILRILHLNYNYDHEKTYADELLE